MGGLLEQGYGRQKKNANDVELLHLPHHDVRHPSKPGKENWVSLQSKLW